MTAQTDLPTGQDLLAEIDRLRKYIEANAFRLPENAKEIKENNEFISRVLSFNGIDVPAGMSSMLSIFKFAHARLVIGD